MLSTLISEPPESALKTEAIYSSMLWSGYLLSHSANIRSSIRKGSLDLLGGVERYSGDRSFFPNI